MVAYSLSCTLQPHITGSRVPADPPRSLRQSGLTAYSQYFTAVQEFKTEMEQDCCGYPGVIVTI